MIKPFPKPLHANKSKWLPKRRAITIVAGFKGPEGIVLCADTQETVGESKRNIPKLRFEPRDGMLLGVPDDELAVCFCGAADNGVFMDELVDRAWEDVQTSTGLDEACDSIRTSIKAHYREAIRTYQTGYCPQTELVYGVKMHGASRLFYGLGPSIAEREKYATGGQGVYLADFIASRTYTEHLSLRQCIILSVYILYEAKENVVGCGGDSHVAILREGRASGLINWHDVKTINEFLQQADRYGGELLLHAADFNLTREEFEERANDVASMLIALRDTQITAIEEHQDFLSTMFRIRKEDEDEFGFSKRLKSQTSKDQP
jgi:20S proteasome alpha/beta subunit